MASQALDPKAVSTGTESNDRRLVARILVAATILALYMVMAITLRNEPVTLDTTPTRVAFEQPFSTQQYWDKAAEYETNKAIAAAAAESPVTYTQQYWDKAAEYEAGKAAAAVAAEPTEEREWAYYTERYWSKTR